MNLIWVAANLRHSKANSHRPAKVVAGQVKSSRSSKGKKRSYNHGTNSVTLADNLRSKLKYEYLHHLHHQAALKSEIILDVAGWIRKMQWCSGAMVEWWNELWGACSFLGEKWLKECENSCRRHALSPS